MGLLEAQQWLDKWDGAARDTGLTPDELASLLFITAALVNCKAGRWLMEISVDAMRKLKVSETDMAWALGHDAQRIQMLNMSKLADLITP